MRLLLPLLLALGGVGGGVGAGLALSPGAADEPLPNPCGALPLTDREGGDHGAASEDASAGYDEAPDADHDASHDTSHDASHDAVPAADHGEAHAGDHAGPAAGAHGEAGAGGHEYVKLNNQFVVPIVEGSDVASLVLMSLSVEVPVGGQEAILLIEPKLRDAFLQALFDHANTGGFEGMFTAASAMRSLRAALLAAAQDEAGSLVTDVLILDLVRQDR